MTLKDEILRIIRDFPEGIGIPFIREVLRESDTTIRRIAGELVAEGLVRREDKFVWRKPYFWFITYYPFIEMPPVPPEYIHLTMVYNKKTKDKEDRTLDISVTYDFDCKNDVEVKDVLKKFLFTKAGTWLDAKFGSRVPFPDRWAEEKERPTDNEVVQRLKSENLDFTMLHYKWIYYRQFGNKTEESEGDLDDWEKEISAGATWVDARKGRQREVK